MRYLEEVKKWLGEITEIALLLIGLGIAFQILFAPEGGEVLFFGAITQNLTGLLSQLGENGLAGLIALGIIFYLFSKKKFTTQNQ
ncbi:MAG: hypothetical protein JW715_08305 [Sedimentisphaerales bacterium]|nr:hypothetical protein [Sedimentisphaerales bacterium]